jgi:hypothetical protein
MPFTFWMRYVGVKGQEPWCSLLVTVETSDDHDFLVITHVSAHPSDTASSLGYPRFNTSHLSIVKRKSTWREKWRSFWGITLPPWYEGQIRKGDSITAASLMTAILKTNT